VSYSAAAIRAAIKDVLEGAIGSVRTMVDGQMLSGVFEGQADQARKAKSLHSATHRFDVRIGRLAQHEASPVSAIGSYRLARADIFVDVTTKTATQVQEDARDDVLASVLSDCEQAAQALSYPANVEQSAALEATGIVSGMLTGPGGEGSPVVEEPQQDWEKQEIRTRISAGCVLRIEQNTLTHSEPLDIFGALLRAWWRGDNAEDEAYAVTTWTDSGRNGFDLTGTPPSNTLTRNVARTTVSAAGFGDALVSGEHEFLPLGAAPNVYVVGRFLNVSIGTVTRIVHGEDGSANEAFSAMKTAADVIAYRVDATTVATATPADSDWHLFEFLHDGTNAIVRVDNATATTGAAAPLYEVVETVGIPTTLTASDESNFEYREVLLLSSYPSETQRSFYRSYVADRYSLSITP
jgi:hypothetical protein